MAEQQATESNKIYINDFGLVNALGANLDDISQNLFSGSQHGFVERDDILLDASVFVAAVSNPLPSLETYPQHFQSRNNQLALQAFQQIAASVESLKQQFSEHRIGVILGTSTSGIAQGEAAMQQRQEVYTTRAF